MNGIDSIMWGATCDVQIKGKDSVRMNVFLLRDEAEATNNTVRNAINAARRDRRVVDNCPVIDAQRIVAIDLHLDEAEGRVKLDNVRLFDRDGNVAADYDDEQIKAKANMPDQGISEQRELINKSWGFDDAFEVVNNHIIAAIKNGVLVLQQVMVMDKVGALDIDPDGNIVCDEDGLPVERAGFNPEQGLIAMFSPAPADYEANEQADGRQTEIDNDR